MPFNSNTNNREVIIRPASKLNLYTLTVLTKRFFPYVDFSTEEIKRRLESTNVKYLVAEFNRGIIGFADFELKDNQCKLMGIAVLEEHRRNGVARKLAERIILEAIKSNCISVFLLVSEDNAPAISLYDSLGFVSKGKSDKVLDGKPIIIMEKLLVN